MVLDVFWMFYLRFLRLKPLFVNYPDAPNRVLVMHVPALATKKYPTVVDVSHLYNIS